MRASTLQPAHINFKVLSESGPLYFSDASCIVTGAAIPGCSICAENCPVSVLEEASQGLAPNLTGACLGCGRCAARCPTGALGIGGFDSAMETHGACARVECARVSRETGAGNATVVPCLGGISLYRLLGWVVDAAPRPVVLMDRGWCTSCPAGNPGCAGSEVVASTAALLASIGWPDRGRPRVDFVPLPIPRGNAEFRVIEEVANPARRNFLGRFAGQRAAGPAPTLRARGPVTMPARERLLAALARLEALTRGHVPARFFPQIVTSPSCKNHQVCAAICPTGALRRYRREGGAGLEFESERCIACGICSRVCPEQAITIAAAGTDADVDATRRTVRVLTRHAQCECSNCGSDFSIDESVGPLPAKCPACRKQESLVASISSQSRNSIRFSESSAITEA